MRRIIVKLKEDELLHTQSPDNIKFKVRSIIYKQEYISQDVFSLWLEAKDIATYAKPGQFVNVYCNQDSRLLPRPISICEVNREAGMIRLVYRVVGAGTKEISQLNKGQALDLLGPLGNGFAFDHNTKSNSLLIAGGIGIPPMLELAKQLKGNKYIILGYRSSELFLVEELSKYGTVSIATEDGSIGTKGNVIDVLRKLNLTIDAIYSCGPKPMLAAVKEYGVNNNIKTQLSLEEKMACGVGACLGCVCKGKSEEGTTVRKRVCKEGPVFLAEEVEL